MRRHRTFSLLFLICWSALPPAAAAAKAEREAVLGKKRDLGGPSEELAGDVSRPEAEAKEGAEQEKPALSYDTFRFAVELRMKEKRHELLATLEQMVELGEDPKEKADLLFRLAELHWEEARYWSFEANRQDDRAGQCLEAQDEACLSRARMDQAEYVSRAERHRNQSVARYKQLIAEHSDYARMDEVLFYLGHGLWESGQEEEALGAYRSLIERFPQSPFVPDAYIAFGEWHFNHSEGKRDMLTKALEAYTRAASFTEARVHGYAIYKQGWCLYNLGEYEAAADKFKATVFYGELSRGPEDTSKLALVREARKDFVLAWSRFGDPTQAKAVMDQVGGKEHGWALRKSLAGLYYDEGRDKEAVLVYRQLIRERPLSPEATFFQSRIVDAVMRVGNKRLTVEQARVLVRIFQEVDQAHASRSEEDEAHLRQARDLAERTLSNLAVVWHNEAKKTLDPETFAYAAAIYADYLALFPDSPKAYDLRFFHAELLYEPLENYEWAANAYEHVIDADLARIEAGEAPGKWFVPALEGAIHAHDQVVQRLPEDAPPAEADPSTPLPIPPQRLALVAACKRYLEHVPEGGQRVEIAYKAAQILYRYNHFDEAVPLFSDIALGHPTHELAVYSAHLILDIYNLLEDYEAIDEWAGRFMAEPRLAKGAFRAELLQIIERNAFQLVARLEKEERYREAAERYVAFVRDWPGSQLAGEALFNASVDYYRAGMIREALLIRDRLFREYPESKLAPRAIYLNGTVFEEIGDFERAAAHFEAYAAAWAAAGRKAAEAGYEEEKARLALYQAGIYREALGDLRAALRNRQRYLELWPRGEESEAVFLSIADLHEKGQSWHAALRHLEAYERRYGKVARKTLIAQQRIARIYEKRGNTRSARVTYDRILNFYRQLSRSVREQLPVEALEGVAIAHARENEPHYHEFRRIQLRLPEQVMAQRLEAKGRALLEVQRRYTQTVAFGVPGPAICALTRIGRAYHEFAQALYEAPVPPGLSEEQEDVYRQVLAEQALPVEAKAEEALASALAKSRELFHENECSREAQALLEQLAPERYPPLRGEMAVVAAPPGGGGAAELLLAEVPPAAASKEEAPEWIEEWIFGPPVDVPTPSLGDEGEPHDDLL